MEFPLIGRADGAVEATLEDVSLAGSLPLGSSAAEPSLFRGEAAPLWPAPWECDGCTIAVDGYLVRQGRLLAGDCPEDRQSLGQALTRNPLALVRSLDNGAFVIVIHDPRQRQTRIITDRLGLVGLYMLRTPESLLFASDLVGIRLLADFAPALDEVGLAELYWFGYQIGRRTCCQGVELAPPGAIVTISWPDGRAQTLRWHEGEGAEPMGPEDLSELPSRIVSTMTTACDRLYNPALRYAIKLSGGMDSRLIAGCWTHPLRRAYTWGDPDCAEMRIGRRLALRLGFEHRCLPVEGPFLSDHYARMHQRFGIMEGTTQFGVAAIAPDGIDACLDGLGGDFMLGGLFQKTNSVMGTVAGALNARLSDHGLPGNNDQIAEQVFRLLRVSDGILPVLGPEHRQRLAAALPAVLQDLSGEIQTHRCDEDTLGSLMGKIKPLTRTRRFISLGAAVARPRMATLYPFLDRGFHELAARLPATVTANKRLYLRLYRQALPRIRSIPPIMSCLPCYLPRPVHYAGRVVRKLREDLGYALLKWSGGAVAVRAMEATQWPKWLVVNPAFRAAIGDYLAASNAADPAAVQSLLDRAAAGKTMVPGNRLLQTVSYCLHFAGQRP